MVLFATPDWAASWAMQWLVIISVTILVTSLGGTIVGVGLLRSNSSAGRKWGGCFLVGVGCLLAFCCLLAIYFHSATVPLENGTHPLGSYPNGMIQEGMSRDVVKAILGPPYQRDKFDHRETWIYLIDTYGQKYFAVDFGPGGQVTSTYGN